MNPSDLAAGYSGSITSLVLKLGQHGALTAHEQDALERASGARVSFSCGDDLVRYGSEPSASLLLTSGLSGRYKVVSSGERQITALSIPGDFVDLESFLLKPMDHAIVALTDCSGIYFPHDELQRIVRTQPRLTKLLWLNTLIDSATHREWLVAMGRLTATQQSAHLVCELFLRLKAAGLTQDNSFELPLTQSELSDAAGLSPVHMNRVIQALRASSMLTWQGNLITIHDWDGLCTFGDFDATYLGYRTRIEN